MEGLIKTLAEERARIWNEYQEALVKPESERTAEDKQKWDKMDADLADIDSRIDVAKRGIEGEAAAAEARAAAEKLIRPTEERTAEQNQDAEIVDWLRQHGNIENPPQRRGFEISLAGIKTHESRVLSVANDPSVVPTSFRDQLYQYLINNTAIRQTNAFVLTTDSGENLVVPNVSAHPSNATIVSEGGVIGTSDPTFAQATLGAYKFAELYQVSTELLQDSAVDLLGYLAKAFGRSLANGSGGKYVIGSGTSEPQGVIGAAGTVYQVVGTTPAANGPSYPNLVDTMHKVIPAYRVDSYWLFNDKTLAALRKITDSNGRPLWQPGLAGFAQGAPNTLMDKPYVIDPNVPDIGVNATSIAFGDFSGFFIRDVAGLRLERSDDFAFSSDMVTFRAILRTDSRLVDTHGAISTYKGATA